MNLQIVNAVATVKLTSTVELEMLAAALKGSEFSASGGRWLKMRLRPENYYIAFYKSGKFLVTGVKSLEEIERIANRVITILKDARMDMDIEKITVHNIVMNGKLMMKASLEKVMFAIDTSKASYEPEQFPGLMYKDFGASFLLFPNGKFIVTGVKTQTAGEEAADKFRQIIEEVQ